MLKVLQAARLRCVIEYKVIFRSAQYYIQQGRIYREANKVQASGPLTCTGPYQSPGRVTISWPSKMGPIGCPETSARNYHHTLL